MELFFSRQPIFDLKERVVGYEVAHQGTREAAANPPTGAAAFDASVRVLVDAIMGAGLERVGEGRPVFVKVTRDVILSETIRLLYPLTIPEAQLDEGLDLLEDALRIV